MGALISFKNPIADDALICPTALLEDSVATFKVRPKLFSHKTSRDFQISLLRAIDLIRIQFI